jgi:hypothetical protein
VQALARQRFGFQRLPVVTAVVFVVTATTSVLGLMVPGMLEVWQRAPQGCTATGGGPSRRCWCRTAGSPGPSRTWRSCWSWAPCRAGPGAGAMAGVCYLGAGLVGELAGYVWQPRGAGNSVAICGLAGALTVALLEGRDNL